jgi:TolB-like protein/DNA-binding winged helix-turn-helix (wHTH) protein/Tfp pilus assembly protein PilF
MAVSIQTATVIRFGAFELDRRLGQLRKHGRKLHLQGQPLQVLEVLVEHAGDVVTRETLRQRLWAADTFVDFDHSLNNAVARIREALGDSAEQPQFVETIPRRGYRFLAPIDQPVASAEGPLAQVAPQTEKPPVAAPLHTRTFWHPFWRRRFPIIGIAAAALSLLALAGAARWWRVRHSANPQVSSIAVLPFTNLSGDPNQEYFADGMTQELITELGKVGALRVISHTSVNRFKATKASLPEIARELNVDALVEGVVARDGNRVRVTANLVRAFPERHIWAQSYDRDLRNVLDLQSEIARNVADQIAIAVTADERLRLNAARPLDPEAHELLLKGDFYVDKWTEAGFQKAIDYFNQSLQRDPRNAQAYAGLAQAYAGLGISDPTAYPKEKTAALKALEIDDALADAHNALAWAELTYDWDTVKAESEFRRAIALNPNDSRAHAYYGIALAMIGRIEDSLREVKRTRELDPLSLAKTSLAWRTYYNAHQYDKAIQVLQDAADMDTNFVSAYQRMIPIYEQMGDLNKAIQKREQAASLGQENDSQYAEAAALLRKAYTAKGASGYWQQQLRILDTEGYSRNAIFRAVVYTQLGRKDDAFRCLDKAMNDRVPYLIWDLPAGPAFDELRSDPRFNVLLSRLVPRSN